MRFWNIFFKKLTLFSDEFFFLFSIFFVVDFCIKAMLKIGKITNALCLTNIIEKIIIRIVVLYKKYYDYIFRS